MKLIKYKESNCNFGVVVKRSAYNSMLIRERSKNQKETSYANVSVETLRIFAPKKTKEDVNDAVGVSNSYRVVNVMMND